MRQHAHEFLVSAPAPGLTEMTDPVRAWVRSCGIEMGLLTLHVRHTSASLLIQENADPAVQRDFLHFFRRLVPHGDALFVHTDEGPDDMAAHIKTALTATTVSIPVTDGALTLGTWQGIFLFEHRDRPRPRRVAAHLIGE